VQKTIVWSLFFKILLCLVLVVLGFYISILNVERLERNSSNKKEERESV
jgi:uncharacterized membrane protein